MLLLQHISFFFFPFAYKEKAFDAVQVSEIENEVLKLETGGLNVNVYHDELKF